MRVPLPDSRDRRHALPAVALPVLVALTAAVVATTATADPLSNATRARAARHEAVRVIAEYDVAAAEAAARAERVRRGLRRDDAAILRLRAQGYRVPKEAARRALAGADAEPSRELEQLPLSVWTIRSREALARLESWPGIRAVHEDTRLRAVSVSDLAFIRASRAAAAGYGGAGTTIAVIDGGLVTDYPAYADFGVCNGSTLGGTCRVVVNQVDYPGLSAETTHGTNVAAIALGVASAARLAMFNVFNGTGASASDVLAAMNAIAADRAGANQYNYVVDNLSLGDGTTNAAQCPGSVFASAIATLSSDGVVTVAAAGNNGQKGGLADPACVPGAVSVGAVYDAGYGTTGWQTSATTSCTDSTTAADRVTCFSQSASYLTLLAPGSFVDAPTSAFRESGTSQAAPHVAGAIAVLRASYPAESPAESLARLTLSGVADADPNAGGRTTPRIDVYGAATLGTQVSVSAVGPAAVSAGETAQYTFTVHNSGPLGATGIALESPLPAGATFVSASAGCTFTAGAVSCAIGSLGNGASVPVVISYRFAAAGPVFVSAGARLDQIDSVPSQQSASIGIPPPAAPLAGDGPLPPWAAALLALAMLAVSRRRLARPAAAR